MLPIAEYSTHALFAILHRAKNDVEFSTAELGRYMQNIRLNEIISCIWMVINCSQNIFFSSHMFLIPHNHLVKIKVSYIIHLMRSLSKYDLA